MQTAPPSMTFGDSGSAIAGSGAPHQHLRLALRAESYAVPIEAVREILEVGRLTVLPCTPDFVRGVLNLRGAVVPIIDLAARFGRGATEIGRRTCIVVVDVHGHGDERDHILGALVDAVYEVFDVPAESLEAVPPLGTSIPAEFLGGIARVRGEAVPVLSLDSALAPATLADLIAHTTVS